MKTSAFLWFVSVSERKRTSSVSFESKSTSNHRGTNCTNQTLRMHQPTIQQNSRELPKLMCVVRSTEQWVWIWYASIYVKYNWCIWMHMVCHMTSVMDVPLFFKKPRYYADLVVSLKMLHSSLEVFFAGFETQLAFGRRPLEKTRCGTAAVATLSRCHTHDPSLLAQAYTFLSSTMECHASGGSCNGRYGDMIWVDHSKQIQKICI